LTLLVINNIFNQLLSKYEAKMHRVISIVIISALFFISCESNENITEPNNSSGETADLTIFFQKPSNLSQVVTNAEAIVYAYDMDTIHTTLTVTDSSVDGTIPNVPAGIDRKFVINCYDDEGNLTYKGSKTIDVEANTTQFLQIVLYPISNTGTVIISGSFANYPDTDQKIVFQADYRGSYDIYIMSPHATDITRLTNSAGDDYYPQLSHDRTKITFNRHQNGTIRPYIMNVDGSNLRELPIFSGHKVGAGMWSPDDSKLAIHANVDGDPDIYIYDIATESIKQIVSNNSIDWIPDWSPDGTELIFYSNKSGMFRIYKVDADGTNLELLRDETVTEERAPRFSPDGSKIAFFGRDEFYDWGIYTVDSDGNNLKGVSNIAHVDELYPSWTPQNQILYKRLKGNNTGYGLYLINPNGTNRRELLDTEFNEMNAHWL
jgi:TolB protein